MLNIKTLRYAALPIVLSVVALGVLVFSLNTLWATVSGLPNLWAEVQALQIESKAASDKAFLLANLDQNELDSLLAQSERALPHDKDVGGILAAITNAKNQTGVNVRSLSLSPGLVSTESGAPVSGVAPTDQQFAVVIDGSIGELFSFLKYLTHGRRLFSVGGIDVSFFEGGEIQATVELVAPFFPDPVVSPTLDQSLTEFSAEERNILDKAESLPLISVPLEGSSVIQPVPGRTNYFGL